MIISGPQKNNGFSLLEAIVALLIVTMVGIATFSWISNLLLSISKIESQSYTNQVKRNVNELLSDINVMSMPAGDKEIGSLVVSWQAELVQPIKRGKSSNGGSSQFELGLYRVNVLVQRNNIQILNFETFQVGHRTVAYDIF
ncbi:PulJ/GspJ family protein [Alteromonas gracilis]|uniref:PulJ/GspJ family protein n=1 Tax=Alteromonas gracilis TaxID=1479524 RepID=UPI002FE1E5A4